jgi:hypothetical protein
MSDASKSVGNEQAEEAALAVLEEVIREILEDFPDLEGESVLWDMAIDTMMEKYQKEVRILSANGHI